MKYEVPTFKGKIIKRYKRFLADIELESGEQITAHTPNTGSMKSCWEPGWDVIVSFHDSPKRKLKHTLELTHNGESWIGVNTGLPNKLAKEAIENGTIKELSGYKSLKPEFKVGDSRIDILLTSEENLEGEKCFVEIKNVTLRDDEGPVQNTKKTMSYFPDSVSTRGQKHLRELTKLVSEGHKAAMLFIVQREDVKAYAPASHIDPEYARLLKEAHDGGVEILVYQCKLSEDEVKVYKKIDLIWP
ncbi:MAG: DNA/RNA nuclease SfsA [Bacteriovoracaceae bacterium]